MKTTSKRLPQPTFLDIETNSDRDTLWMVAYREPGMSKAKCLVGDDVQEHLQTIIDRAQCLCAHNTPFDKSKLKLFGFNVDDVLWHDTLLMSYLVNPNVEPIAGKKHALEAWGKRLKKRKIDLRQALIDAGLMQEGNRKLYEFDLPKFKPAALPIMAKYACQDVDLDYDLFWHLYPQMDKHLWKLYKSIELPFQQFLMESSEHGVLIDVPLLDKIEAEFAEDLECYKMACQALCPIAPAHTRMYVQPRPDEEGEFEGGLIYVGTVTDKNGKLKHKYKVYDEFNPNAPQHKEYALRTLYGWEPSKYTKKGNVQLDSDVLEELPTSYEIVEWLLEYSEINKLHSTYCVGMKKFIDEDGIIKPEWNQTVTLTGRLSSSNPNLQNIPARTDRGKRLREVFIARPGYKLVGIDGSQVQLRILAWYLAKWCNDYSMWDAYQGGVADIHEHNAKIWGVERKVAKNITFAKIFQASIPKLSRMIGTTEEVTQELVDRVERENPSLKRLIEKVLDKAEREGGVLRTLYGRRLCYPDLANGNKWRRFRAQRQAFNAIIQGTEADVMKVLGVKCAPIVHKYEARLLLQVHDEYLFECPEDCVEEFAELIKAIFHNRWVLFGLQFTGDCKIGDTWAGVH